MTRRRKIDTVKFALLIAALITVGAMPARAAMEDYPEVELRLLDKSTARATTQTVPVGSTIQYGSLYIKIQACRKADPIEKPESASFLQVWELPPEEQESRWVFSGWMFASSPALSAMDHPVYDVWVLNCTGREEELPPPTEEPEEQAEEVIAPDAPDSASDIQEEEILLD